MSNQQFAEKPQKLFTMTTSEMKKHYIQIFDEERASESEVAFQGFLRRIVKELAVGLKVNLDLLDVDLADSVLCSARRFKALEALQRVLLPVAEGANYKATYHPDWSLLAGRIEMQRLKLITPETFKEMLKINTTIWKSDKNYDYFSFATRHAAELEALIVPERDYDLYFFGVRTLEKSYLIRLVKHGNKLLETPQRLYLRIAAFLFMPNFEMIKEYYDLMSLGYFTHATPTMFHAGIANGSLASCFLLSLQDDLKKIFMCLSQCAMISKAAGGIGLDVSNIRHSTIGEMGTSSGIVPVLQIFDKTMRYVDQGGDKRKGSAAIFLQPWHIDFPDFLLLKRQHGMDEQRARDLYYAVWNCDLFMTRVKNDEMWTLFCPKSAPMLTETFGEEFNKWYHKYETMYLKQETEAANSGDGDKKIIFMKRMSARELWNEMLTTQIETGMPFMVNKDTANYTSNQKNLGIIRSSNLCQEICEVTNEETISSCNLASIALDEYVGIGVDGAPVYDHKKLGQVVRLIIRGLNRVIDRTSYPLQDYDKHNNFIGDGPIKTTNLKYRPLGLGVQALADTFLKMNLAWTDPEAKALNKEIFATIYYNAVSESIELAREEGVYEGFYGSPASEGLLKPDLVAAERARKKLYVAGVKTGSEQYYREYDRLRAEILAETISDKYDWGSLRARVKEYGLRNSLLVALMPTASSAQIRYKNEAFEPFTTNMYTRSVLSGNHLIVNRYMVTELEELGLWNKSTRDFLIKNEGSILNLPNDLVAESQQPKLQRLKEKCKTAFELSQKLLADLSIDRASYVCQSQSFNVHIKDPSFKQLTSLHFYAWENGLTTGMYYLRTAPSVEAVKFTIDNEIDLQKTSVVCTDDVCVSCQG